MGKSTNLPQSMHQRGDRKLQYPLLPPLRAAPVAVPNSSFVSISVRMPGSTHR